MDKNFVIQFIVYDVHPCKIENCPFYNSPKEIKSKYVLEINSGMAEKIELKAGSKMRLSY